METNHRSHYRFFMVFGAVLGLLAVMLGAVGSHAFKNFLLEAGRVETYETAVKYHFYHSIVLFLCGIAGFHLKNKSLFVAGYALFVGVLLFSGSLYVLCFTGFSWLRHVTPFGGVSIMIGWASMGVAAYRYK
jgi:uncharacterized membrane protein YgdD (TMEM256/DUF423 family)